MKGRPRREMESCDVALWEYGGVRAFVEELDAEGVPRPKIIQAISETAPDAKVPKSAQTIGNWIRYWKNTDRR
jgi:hypothetical protein